MLLPPDQRIYQQGKLERVACSIGAREEPWPRKLDMAAARQPIPAARIRAEGWRQYIDSHPELHAQGFPIFTEVDVDCSQKKVLYVRADPTACAPVEPRLTAAEIQQHRDYRQVTRPLGVNRFTAHQATCRGSNGVTGASEWIASGTPCRKAEPHASSRIARSGPMVRS